MDSKPNIDSKLSADAMNQGTSNLNSSVTNGNPLFQDQKRVIKKMFVMDTSRLKGLGIESTIKNAMSKLGKGNLKKSNQVILKTVNAQPTTLTTSTPTEIIKTEPEPKIVPTQPTDTVTKHVNRPDVPFTPSISTTEDVPVQPKSMPQEAVPLTRSPVVSTENAVFQTVKLVTPQATATINIVQNASVPTKYPMVITSTGTIPTIKPQHNVQVGTNCNPKVVQPQVTVDHSPLIKTESSVPSDGKKIKILSDVCLNDTKAKLLEIDKLSSKNLKFTNVIKGTDTNASKSTVHPHPDSALNAEFSSRSKPPVEGDKMSNPKFINVIPRTEGNQSHSTVSSSHCTTTKPFKSATKVNSSIRLNANDGMDKGTVRSSIAVSNCTDQNVASTNTTAMPTNVESRGIASKYVKTSPLILNYTNANKGCIPNSQFPRTHAKPPPTTTAKPSTMGVDNISTRNVIFTSASKPTACFTTTTSKFMHPSSPSVSTKSESNQMHPPNQKAHFKGTKDYPSVQKIVKPIPSSTSSTSAATEVSTKQLVTTDENIEIIVPSKQKYLSSRDKSGMHERTPICNPTKPFHDVLWSTHNPRTYARHNVNRLLSDKIIKKPNVQKVQTSENVVASAMDKGDTKCDGTGTEPSENPIEILHETPPSSVSVSHDNFYGFSIEEVHTCASILSQLKALLSRKRTKEVPKMENVNCHNDNWILNHETGVLEEQASNVDSMVTDCQDVSTTVQPDDTENASQATAETTAKKKDSDSPTTLADDEFKKRLDSITSTCDDSPLPSKLPVIEDADDEISDIDLVHRSKTRCSGNAPTVKTRRAILKSVELHRKAFMPATTDDESERPLCVRPPRPKLRKLRQKQTVEQLKIQQSAHVSLLKRFVQTDSNHDNWNDESLVFFVDGIEERMKVLTDQVDRCFNQQSRVNVNVKTNNLSEQVQSIHLNTNESVKKSGEVIVAESNDLVENSESFTSPSKSLNCVVTCEPQQPTSDPAVKGQSTVHEITIQKETFLVTEYNDQCDKIHHLPLKVKEEKETSPQPSCSVDRSREKKLGKSAIRKKRKRKSLVEMLAQHIDQDTLKSVIMAHAKQKCETSSSPDSDSDNEASDVVSKIFRTVCTIDLCDDDDETLHEDVLQYLNETEQNEAIAHRDFVSPDDSDKLRETSEHLKALEEKISETKVKSEGCFPAADKTTNYKETEKVCDDVGSLSECVLSNTTDSTEKTPYASVPHTHHGEISSSPPTISNDVVMDTEPNTLHPSDDVEMVDATGDVQAETESIIPTPSEDVEMVDTADDTQCDTRLDDTVKLDDEIAPELDDTHDTSVTKEPHTDDVDVKTDIPVNEDAEVDAMIFRSTTKEPEKVITDSASDNISKQNTTFTVDTQQLKSKSIEETSSSVSKPSDEDPEFEEVSKANRMLPVEEHLNKTASVISKKSKRKSKCKVNVSKSKNVKSKAKKPLENSVDSKEDKDRLTPKIQASSESTDLLSKERIQISSVSVNDDAAAGTIKIKIKLGLDSNPPKSPTSTSDTLNRSLKSTRSYKRKWDVLNEPPSDAIITTNQSEAKRKRPMFDYFSAPEILTTKRTRKSKSYVDENICNDATPTPTKIHSLNHRISRRKSAIPNSVEENVVTKSKTNVEEAIVQIDAPAVESVEAKTEPIVQEQPLKVKSGRGVKPPVLAPLNVASKYVCGNCKQEVVAKSWTKHMRIHYGLAWRVDVDPPIEMDNIHSMSSKMINFTKKANIRILKCDKCGVEKKSALGYLSHLEVCGLTPEEIKSKLVKCEYCPSMIRNSSMKIHLTFCSGLKQTLQKENEPTKEVESSEECFNEAGRAVRRSAQKARSSFKELDKPPEAKVEDYVERVQKISYKQQRKWRQLLNGGKSIECLRNGCEFTTDDMVAMTNHFKTCVLVDGETFYCNRCDHGPDSRAAVEEHIKANHSLGVIESIDDITLSESDAEAELEAESSESEGESGDEEISERDDDESHYDDEDDDGWNNKGYKRKRIRDWGHNEVMLNNCLDRKVLTEHSTLLKAYSGGSYFQPALEWTHDFRDKNFSSKELLPFATPNTFSVLNATFVDLYLPRILTSNKFFVKDVRKYKKQFGSTEFNKSGDWKSLNRFEATKDNSSIVLFTVLSMAWLPLPDDHLSQILAVCCRNNANDDILLNNTKPVKCLIQIWNFDQLKNGQLRQAQAPNLLYSIAYDHGPVIQMEFCPSTDDLLGLLAVSSCDGHVDILALPKNFTCDNSTIENLVFTIQPSLILCCERDQPLGVLMTKLTWSQSKGHTKLAGGYSNGLVAIWNLKNLETPNICNKVNGKPTLLPTDVFYAGNKTIRLLEFHHEEKNEARWLIAGSHDRKVKFFDTHNVYVEISTTVAHSRIVTGCWPLHWSSFLLGIDNAYSLKVSGIVVKQPLDIGCRTSTFYSIIGSTCDISFNNWLNAYAFVTSYGDIHVGYARQMISGFCETRRQRSILGFTDAVNIDQSNCGEGGEIVSDGPVASDDEQPSGSCAIEQTAEILYPSADGIIFCDFQNPLPAVTSPSIDKIRGPPMSAYNMVRVNRILFNPNASAHKLYALGYEAGFVRINQFMPK